MCPSDAERPAGGSVAAEPPDPQVVASAVRDPVRLAAVRDTGLLDTGPEEQFDRLTRLAAELLDAPVSLISLIDENRQYFKSAIGLAEPWASARETPLSHSICQHVITADGPLVIEDTREVEALRGNRAPDELGVGAYAGVPLRDESGQTCGAFCVIDSHPRAWSPRQLALVEQLGAAAAAEMELRDRLSHALLNDAATGLPNRDQFAAFTEDALAASHGLTVVVTAIGIPGLGSVNASLGRDVGRRMLVGIAARLKEGLPEALVAKIAEDEFGVLSTVNDDRQALALADTARELLLEPFEVEGHTLHAAPGVGIAVGDSTDTAEGLLEGAAAALFHACESPERVQAVGSQTLHADALERLKLENAFRTAIQRNALRVFYQPKVRLADRCLIGFEALARWEDPDLGDVPPSTFIPIAEESGLIAPLGQFVLAEACRQAVEWRGAFPALRLSMAVNVSPRQLHATDVSRLAAEALAQSGLPADRLALEITESALLRQPREQLERLSAMSRRGIALNLDDFGTGYSSLSYLGQLPLDALKLDRSFVIGLHDERTEAIVRAIMAIATALRIDVIAEGIETEEQLERLRMMGCAIGQGYVFGRPEPPENLQGRLRDAELAVARKGSPVGGRRQIGDAPKGFAEGDCGYLKPA